VPSEVFRMRGGNLMFAVGISIFAGMLLHFDTPEDMKLPLGISLILIAQFAIKHKIEELEKKVEKWKETSDSDSKK
jgi:hypothetical protein